MMKIIDPYKTALPVKWEDVKLILPPAPPIQVINLGNDQIIPYWETAFGRLEAELFQRKPESLET